MGANDIIAAALNITSMQQIFQSLVIIQPKKTLWQLIACSKTEISAIILIIVLC